MSNGKGSRARSNHSEKFRSNYDQIQWKPKKPQQDKPKNK